MKKLILSILLIPIIIFAAGEVSSPNMGMPIPTVGVTTGPTYATDINRSLLIIDKHNHSPGYGVPVTPTGLNMTDDLTFQNHNITNIRAARFTNQSASFPSTSPDIGEMYVVGGELYYNDTAGNIVPITKSGSVNAGAGSITGLPSGTAGVSYSSISKTYSFLSATSTDANIDAGSYILRYPGSYPTPSGNYILLEAPSGLSTAFALVYPSTLPATSGSWMTSDTSGVQSWTKVDNASLQFVSNVISIKNNGVGPAQITTTVPDQVTLTGGNGVALSVKDGGISTAKLADLSVTNAKLAASNYALSSAETTIVSNTTTTTNFANLTATITTSGRPVKIELVPGTSTSSSIQFINLTTSNYTAKIYLKNGAGTVIQGHEIQFYTNGTSQNLTEIPASSVSFFDTPAAGSVTYQIAIKLSFASVLFGVGVNDVKLLVREL